jgi:hypothetical protein
MEDSNVGPLIERIRRPHVLHDRIYPTKLQLVKAGNVELLINRLAMREWLNFMEEQLIKSATHLRTEVKFIEHLPHCWMCQMELQLDVERYNGTHLLWYLCLENSEYLEEQYSDCPREKDYTIDNYWAQVERYRKTGTTERAEVNTLKFIMDRAKWAYKIMGKQIHLARQLLKFVRTWDFSEQTIMEFNKLYEEFAAYEIG